MAKAETRAQAVIEQAAFDADTLQEKSDWFRQAILRDREVWLAFLEHALEAARRVEREIASADDMSAANSLDIGRLAAVSKTILA